MNQNPLQTRKAGLSVSRSGLNLPTQLCRRLKNKNSSTVTHSHLRRSAGLKPPLFMPLCSTLWLCHHRRLWTLPSALCCPIERIRGKSLARAQLSCSLLIPYKGAWTALLHSEKTGDEFRVFKKKICSQP